MKLASTRLAAAPLLWLVLASAGPARAQQFNSDSWISKPNGTVTTILTTGEQTTMWMTTMSLLPRWEFTASAYVYNRDADRKTGDDYSTSLYAKYMPWTNAEGTGGLGIKGGLGMKPAYVAEGQVYREGSQTWWMNAPLTLPFFGNRLSIDLMPGASVTLDYPEKAKEAWAFTYSARAAWYPVDMELALVGEVFGAEGQATNPPDYKVGLRWEPDVYTNIAVTYGRGFDGSPGAGFEVGIMLFSPPFFCIGPCRK